MKFLTKFRSLVHGRNDGRVRGWNKDVVRYNNVNIPLKKLGKIRILNCILLFFTKKEKKKCFFSKKGNQEDEREAETQKIH